MDTVFVPCKQCSRAISAERAACPISHGLCPDCNAPLLKTSREARENEPMYETQAFAEGVKLD